MDFALEIENWYACHKRDLPWRDIADPYLIWISEIILQQTRVVQGYDYYLRFVRHFPDVGALASASEEEVLNVWQGLGYYSRARNLHAAARSIVENGRFPDTYEGVRALKGVGDYTAAAICSFAYGMPYATVDGNVYRVLARYFGIEIPIDTNEGKRTFSCLAQKILDKQRPGLYNQALMDFGALQCVPHSPDCQNCPLQAGCFAFEHNKVKDLPMKQKRPVVTERFLVYVFITAGKNLFLRRREGRDIWKGLYEPYLMEFDHAPSEKDVLDNLSQSLLMRDATIQAVCKGMKHVLTHRRLFVDCYAMELLGKAEIEGYHPIPLTDIEKYPFPRLVSALLEKLSF